MLYKKNIIILLILFQLILLCSSCGATAIDTMENNLDMSIADIIMIIASCGIIIIIAFDARIALMCALLIYTSIFILYTTITEEGTPGFNPYYSGIAMMVCFILICLSLLITYKKSNTPLNIV